MADNTSPFGWDLLYNSVANSIKHNEDLLVCLNHFVLITNGFKCIGLGDSKNMDGNEDKSETLPQGWNDDYKLRYTYQGRLYNVQAVRLDDGVMINMIRVDERTVSMVQLNTRLVSSRTGSLSGMVPTYTTVIKLIKEQLIDKIVVSNKSKDGASQTPKETQQTDLRTGVPQRGSFENDIPNRLLDNRSLMYPNPLIGVGRNDLDPLAGMAAPGFGGIPGFGGRYGNPLGGGGGGMLFQPPGRMDPVHPGLPPGAVPPGARFDPFRPPDTDRFQPRPRNNMPDNDEMPPPGFDDMYM